MFNFQLKPKNFVYLAILLIPFYLIFTRASWFDSLRFTFIKVLAGPARLLSFPIQEAKKILYYHRTFEEYKRLKDENNLLRARLIGLDEVLSENARLEKLLDFKRKLIFSSVAASIIGRSPSRWDSALLIDKGSDDGIKQGMAVVNELGVVGKIAEVSATTSKVILLIDPQFSVAALVQGSRETGVVTGSLSGVARMKFIGPEAKIQRGDKIITSKISTSFPESLMIGEVIEVMKADNKPSQECLIQPVVSLSRLEEVLVILKE